VDRSLRRLHGAAVVRILFGLLWAIDAWLKWLPGFIDGQTMAHELNPQAVSTPVVHGWVQLWHDVAGMNPGMFAMGTAVIETVLAVALILGILSKLTFIVTAAWSFGIWTAPEHMHLPWGTPGMTETVDRLRLRRARAVLRGSRRHLERGRRDPPAPGTLRPARRLRAGGVTAIRTVRGLCCPPGVRLSVDIASTAVKRVRRHLRMGASTELAATTSSANYSLTRSWVIALFNAPGTRPISLQLAPIRSAPSRSGPEHPILTAAHSGTVSRSPPVGRHGDRSHRTRQT